MSQETDESIIMISNDHNSFEFTSEFPNVSDKSYGADDDSDGISTECQFNTYLDISPKIRFFCSLLTMLCLVFIVRRRTTCMKCCWGRPGLLQPIDFIDEIGRRWAYGACCVIITVDVTDLFVGNSFWDILSGYDDEWMSKYGFVNVFIKLLDVLSVCLVHYPLFACIDHRRFVVANIFGSLHSIPMFVFYIVYFHACPIFKQQDLDIAPVIYHAPIFVAYFVVGFSYAFDFSVNIQRWKKKRRLERSRQKINVYDSSRSFKVTHHLEYAANLLRKRDATDWNIEAASNGVKAKLKRTASRVKYERIFGFRYSTRLICCMTICTTILIWFAFSAVHVIDFVIDAGTYLCNYLNETTSIDPICDNLLVGKILAHFSTIFSALLIFAMLVHSLIIYKRRWHQLLKGDHSWHPFGSAITTPQNTLLTGLKFAGYQVAYVIWGYFVLACFTFIVITFITFAFILPLRDGVRNWLIKKLSEQWPTLLLGIIIIPLAQKFICQFFLLQDKGNVMALTNRRLYNALSYYFFFLNIIVGMFACLKRILIPLVLGIAFLSRLDQPLIMKGFESNDPGYAAFVCMLLVDLHHNHPLVKTFVDLLLQVRNNRPSIEETGAGHSPSVVLHSKRIRNRWMKTITLVNNPCLVLKTLELRLIDERNQRASQIPLREISVEESRL